MRRLSLGTKILIGLLVGLALGFLWPTAVTTAVAVELTPEEIARLEAEEQAISVRPGDPANGRPFWNVRAFFFRRPPNFDFKPVAGAKDYEYLVVDANHARHTFVTNIPSATLAPVWAKIPAGPMTVFCEGRDAKGAFCGRAGLKRFSKSAYFTGAYPKAPRGRSEAISRAYDYIAGLVTNKTSIYRSYPTKMGSSAIEAMVKYADRVPERRETALAVARAEADALLATRARLGTPLAGFTLTYAAEPIEDETKEATWYRGQSMNVYPSQAGAAFLSLYGATGDTKYLEAAKDIGETYLRRQLPNGTWYLKERFADGEPVNKNLLVPNSTISFFLALNRATGDKRYLDAADRAFAYLEKGPLATWNWEGQFEDVEPSKRPYRNHTIHMSCDTALYLLERYPGDAKRLAEAREILRFAEDQFVFWERPNAPWTESFAARRYPAAFEQYACYTPIDSSAAKAIKTYLALYRVEHRPLDLLKAKALADSIVAVQDEDGRIPTWWEVETVESRNSDWINCMVAATAALEDLADEDVGDDAARPTISSCSR